jgi:antitoxin (DNA-binding transcriptional repressor) of toxin-antitoxin stability system
MIFTVHQAKTQLSRLIAAALEGDEVIIARGDKPVVRLTALESPKPGPRFGSMKGQIALTDAFFEPLPREDLAGWNGEAD